MSPFLRLILNKAEKRGAVKDRLRKNAQDFCFLQIGLPQLL